MIVAGIIVGWLLMGGTAYVLIRWSFRRDNIPWTTGRRAEFLIVSLLFAPAMFFAGLMAVISSGDTEAKW